MDYQVKVNGETVAGAWSEHSARRKALRLAFSQAQVVLAQRCHVEVWKGREQITSFGAAHSSEDRDAKRR